MRTVSACRFALQIVTFGPHVVHFLLHTHDLHGNAPGRSAAELVEAGVHLLVVDDKAEGSSGGIFLPFAQLPEPFVRCLHDAAVSLRFGYGMQLCGMHHERLVVGIPIVHIARGRGDEHVDTYRVSLLVAVCH